jgi:hypothetical protein
MGRPHCRYQVITEEMIKLELRKYHLSMVQDFVRLFMPLPLSDKRYRYITIRTVDNVLVKLWGNDLQEIWDQFQRFTKIGIFV